MSWAAARILLLVGAAVAATWSGGTWTTPFLSAKAGAILTAAQRTRVDDMDAPLDGAWQVYMVHHDEAREAVLVALRGATGAVPVVLPPEDVARLVTAERGLRDTGVAPFLRLLRLVESGGRGAIGSASASPTAPGFASPGGVRVRMSEATLDGAWPELGQASPGALAPLVTADQARLQTATDAIRAWRIAVLSLDLTSEEHPADRLGAAYTTLSTALDADVEARVTLAARLLSITPAARRPALLAQPDFLAWAALDSVRRTQVTAQPSPR